MVQNDNNKNKKNALLSRVTARYFYIALGIVEIEKPEKMEDLCQ